MNARAIVKLSANSGLIVLTAIFMAALVTSTLIGSKLVQFGSVTLSAGVLVFPFTFLSLDIAADCYGKAEARTIIKVGICIQIFVLFFVWLGGALPASPLRDLGDAYAKMFSLTTRMVTASIVAYVVSQTLDVAVFLRLKAKTKGRFLWLRTNAATLTSQLIDTAIFSAIFLAGVIPIDELVKTATVVYLAKIILGFLNTPFVYIGRHLIGKQNV
jgi:queuosine precursor transporter